MLLLQKKIQK